jgi:hypothetical protein
MNGTVVPVQHCVDFIYAGDALATDLSAQQKTDMVGFVKRELLTKDWMRAMSWKDPAAARSFRPDHSPTGSYDGWIPLTVATMWKLGATQEAFDFYCRTADVTQEGPFAQAHEFYGPTPASNDAPVRIALHGSNMKECISGVAFADVVIGTFFGYDPSVDGKTILRGEQSPRPFAGQLENVRQGNTWYTISADRNGIRSNPQAAPAEIRPQASRAPTSAHGVTQASSRIFPSVRQFAFPWCSLRCSNVTPGESVGWTPDC